MKIAVLVLYTEDWEDLYNMVGQLTRYYCDKHGYVYHLHFMTDDCKKDIGFTKVKLARALFQINAFDAIWVLDGDVLITSFKNKIEDYITDDNDLFICKDPNGINAGSWIIKKTEWSIKFLDYILEYQNKGGWGCEQDAIVSYMKEYPNDEKIKILPHPSINSVPYEHYFPSFGKIGFIEGEKVAKPTHKEGCWQQGDLVCHLPGRTISDRVSIFRELREKMTEYD